MQWIETREAQAAQRLWILALSSIKRAKLEAALVILSSPMIATLNLILETLDNQKISARSPEFPDCIAIADTREAAIAAIQQQLRDRLKTIEFVSIPLPISAPPAHTLADSFGVFKDDPYFAEILQRMRSDRELDSDNPAYT